MTAALGCLSLVVATECLASCGPTLPSTCQGCGPDQARDCSGNCVTPVEVGSACSIDPCAPNGQCVSGARCVTSYNFLGDNGMGVCDRQLAVMPTTACAYEAGGEDPCAWGPAGVGWEARAFFCSPPKCGGPSVCTRAGGVGDPCDGVMELPQTTSACQPCAPGLACQDGHCFKRCNNSSDCDCVHGSSCAGPSLPTDPLAPPGACVSCSSLRQSCDRGHPCCDGSLCGAPGCDPTPNTTCMGIVGTCCRATGEPCSARGDCCGASSCRAGRCEKCIVRDAGQCWSDDDCCSGLSCIGNVCRKRCVPGGTCDTGQKGACQAGVYVCPSEYVDPVCQRMVGPTSEDCSGADRDCDGTANDIPATACQAHPPECEKAYPEGIQGVWKCENGQQVCDATGYYCKVPGTKTINGQYCGSGPGGPCPGLRLSECAPHLGCAMTVCTLVDACSPHEIPACWLPKDNGYCLPM